MNLNSMTILQKTTLFRRLVDSVPFFCNRKNFYFRLLTCLSSYTSNLSIDFKLYNLEKVYILPYNIQLVDVIEVRSYYNPDDHIIIRVYIDQSLTVPLHNIYFKVYV